MGSNFEFLFLRLKFEITIWDNIFEIYYINQIFIILEKFKENPKTGVVEHSDSKWVTIDDIKDNKSLELRTFPVYLLNRALEKLNNDQGS